LPGKEINEFEDSVVDFAQHRERIAKTEENRCRCAPIRRDARTIPALELPGRLPLIAT
jgi:hypothetical protein